MKTRKINAEDALQTSGYYAQAVEVSRADRLLFISGQIPESVDGAVPDGFEAQCRQVWANIEAVLAEAGLSLDHLVKVTTFLTSRDQAETNGRTRRAVLGERRPALTVMVAQTLESRWLLEIEAVAAA